VALFSAPPLGSAPTGSGSRRANDPILTLRDPESRAATEGCLPSGASSCKMRPHTSPLWCSGARATRAKLGSFGPHGPLEGSGSQGQTLYIGFDPVTLNPTPPMGIKIRRRCTCLHRFSPPAGTPAAIRRVAANAWQKRVMSDTVGESRPRRADLRVRSTPAYTRSPAAPLCPLVLYIERTHAGVAPGETPPAG